MSYENTEIGTELNGMD